MIFSKTRLVKTIRFVRRHLFLVACLLFVGYMLVGGDYSVLNIWSLRVQEAELRKEKKMYEDATADYQKRIDELEVDSEQLERYAREQLHMHRENEDLYLMDK